MKIIKTMKECMNKHQLAPKQFSIVSGIPEGTCKQISSGRPSPVLDTFAIFLNYSLSHGMTRDKLEDKK